MAEEKKKTRKPAAKPAKKTAKPKKPASKPEKPGKPASSKVEKPSKFAVIKTGGKQYVVREGLYYDFEKLTVDEGKDVIFEEVLLVADGSNVKIGEPKVAGAKVTGKVLSQFKAGKVTVFKYKPKKRYRKTQGHRQQKTKVQITKIS